MSKATPIKWGEARNYIVIRCSCGEENTFFIRAWSRRKALRCSGCKHLISYKTLEVLEPPKIDNRVTLVLPHARIEGSCIATNARGYQCSGGSGFGPKMKFCFLHAKLILLRGLKDEWDSL